MTRAGEIAAAAAVPDIILVCGVPALLGVWVVAKVVAAPPVVAALCVAMLGHTALWVWGLALSRVFPCPRMPTGEIVVSMMAGAGLGGPHDTPPSDGDAAAERETQLFMLREDYLGRYRFGTASRLAIGVGETALVCIAWAAVCQLLMSGSVWQTDAAVASRQVLPVFLPLPFFVVPCIFFMAGTALREWQCGREWDRLAGISSRAHAS